MKRFVKNQQLLKSITNNLGIKCYLLKSLIKHNFFLINIKNKAIVILKTKTNVKSISVITNVCMLTLNKKKFSKLSAYSRQILNNKIQNGEIYGFIKYSW